MVLIINQFVIISIHALREEGDNDGHPAGARPEDFYPRPPRGGRLKVSDRCCYYLKISIHALREEGDNMAGNAATVYADFYPRPPRGGRRCRYQH